MISVDVLITSTPARRAVADRARVCVRRTAVQRTLCIGGPSTCPPARPRGLATMLRIGVESRSPSLCMTNLPGELWHPTLFVTAVIYGRSAPPAASLDDRNVVKTGRQECHPYRASLRDEPNQHRLPLDSRETWSTISAHAIQCEPYRRCHDDDGDAHARPGCRSVLRCVDGRSLLPPFITVGKGPGYHPPAHSPNPSLPRTVHTLPAAGPSPAAVCVSVLNLVCRAAAPHTERDVLLSELSFVCAGPDREGSFPCLFDPKQSPFTPAAETTR